MTDDDRPRLRAELVCRRFDEEFAVYDPIADRTTFWNVAAGAVLERCDGTRTVREIGSEVAAAFEGDAERITADVRAALLDFRAKNLLET